VNNSSALQAALASGLTPAEALARSTAQAAALAAQQSQAAVAQSDADKVGTSLGQGNLGSLGDGGSAGVAANQLASGKTPAEAVAAAQQAAATKAAMQSQSQVDLSASSGDAAGLARDGQSGAPTQSPVLAALLAQGLSPDAAEKLVAAADAERVRDLAQAQIAPTDPDAANLAAGIVPAGYHLASLDGPPLLVADHSTDQGRAAQTGAADDLNLHLATGTLPAALRQELAEQPALATFLSDALCAGDDFATALDRARRHARQQRTQETQMATLASDTLDRRLATGHVTESYYAQLAGPTPQTIFRPVMSGELQNGTPPWQAVQEAGGVAPSDFDPSPIPNTPSQDVRTTP